VDINDLTYQVNAAIFEVNRELGPGFLEKVYENALLLELRKMSTLFSSAMSAEEKVCVCLCGSVANQSENRPSW
jgi:GxxExxY protein